MDGSRRKEESLVTMKAKFVFPSISILFGLLFSFLLTTAPSYATEEPGGKMTAHSDGSDTTIATEVSKTESAPGGSSNNHKPSDDIPRLTNDATPSTDTVTSMADRNCDGKRHEGVQPDGTTTLYACRSLLPKTGEAGWTPTTREILYYAATTIHADGAGLHKRPEGVSYTNKYIPTLVAATHPTQTHTITLLGRDITVTLTATSYTWSWGDGTPDLTTTSAGMPWQEGMDPNTDPALIRHYYKAPNGWKSFLDGPYPSATRTITLTTTWAGTATNPFTGETQTINGLVTTTETTGPFPLGQLIVNNTDTAEEKQGH